MRAYQDRKNLQKKAYYSDRFFKAPPVPRKDVSTDEIFANDLKHLKSLVKIKDSYIELDQLVVIIEPKDICKVMLSLKQELEYDFLSELSATDFLAKSNQFEIFYQLLSMSKRKRLRVKYMISQDQAIDSIMHIFKSADWAEREMFDMFGIVANNHTYLKRLLMPEDWVGYPLLKSYPLEGDEAAKWYEVDKIFGKEYRDIIGPEMRDSATINIKDTKNFARVKHEVPYGEKYSGKPTDFGNYQEDGGVPLISKFKKENSKELNSRK